MEKTVILNQNRDFLQLYQRGKKIASPYVIIYLRKTRRKHNRLGITVGKKVGCAVKRSRARRIIRQAYRETEHLMPVGVDMVIVALPSITGIRSTQLRDYLAGNGVRRIRNTNYLITVSLGALGLRRIRKLVEPPSEGGKPK